MSQTLSLVEQLRSLEQLQEIDLKIDQLKQKQRALPETLQAIDESLKQLHSEIEAKRVQFTEADKLLSQSKAAMDLNKERIGRANQKLETVQNSQEFQAATKEMDQLKKAAATLEAQITKSTEEVDSFKKALDEMEEKKKNFLAERSEKEKALESQSAEFEGQIKVFDTDKAQFVDKVEDRILRQYNRVRQARNGLGIVPALGGRCKGCNMIVPPQLFNEVQSGSTLHACPSCHRILFVPSDTHVDSE